MYLQQIRVEMLVKIGDSHNIIWCTGVYMPSMKMLLPVGE